MVTDFDVIHQDAPVSEAIDRILHGPTRKTGHKTISIMVVDDFRKLAGVVTMFDILYHLRPSFLNYGIEGTDMNWQGQLQALIKSLKEKKVHQIMSADITGAEPEEHLMVLVDRMVKHRFRRLPVLDNGKPMGIVYISDVYDKLFTSF
jgi:CBS domain-containing protein